MDLSGLSALSGGFQKGQSLQADLATQQEQAKQMRLKTQEMLDDRTQAAWLGKAFGLDPSSPPQPQGGGAPPAPPMQPPPAPMVTTSTGAPAGPPQMPPGAQYGAPPQGPPPPGAAPPQGGPPVPQQGMPPRPPMAPPPQAQQRPPQPPVPPQIAANLGQMSVEQLAQRIIRANPEALSRPDLLFGAVMKGQAALTPDSKATLAVMQLNQKAEQLQNKLDVQTMNDQTKLQVQNMVDNVKTQLEQFKQAGADKRQTDKLEEHISEVDKKIAAKHEDVAATNTSREKIAFAGNVSKEKVAQKKIAAQKDLLAGKDLSPQSLAFYAQALRAGNLQAVNEVLGMSKNRAGIMDQIVKEAQIQDPDFDGGKITQAMLNLGGQKAAVGVVGRTAGGVAVGAEELPQYMPQIEQAIKAVNTSDYPTVNSIIQAYDKGSGDPEVVFLRNMVQGARNAYQQIAARGGRMTVFGAQQAQDLISGNMPVSQFAGAARALIKEAEINKGATGAAMSTVTQQEQGGTMVTDARKVAKMRGAGDDAAYESARDDYLKRYGEHGGDQALRKALKETPVSGASGEAPAGAPTATDAKGNKVYWDGATWKPAPRGQ